VGGSEDFWLLPCKALQLAANLSPTLFPQLYVCFRNNNNNNNNNNLTFLLKFDKIAFLRVFIEIQT